MEVTVAPEDVAHVFTHSFTHTGVEGWTVSHNEHARTAGHLAAGIATCDTPLHSPAWSLTGTQHKQRCQ